MHKWNIIDERSNFILKEVKHIDNDDLPIMKEVKLKKPKKKKGIKLDHGDPEKMRENTKN